MFMKNIQTFESFINESYLNEGAVKQFEIAVKNLINNVRAGYGWIDPEYVYDTVVSSSEFDDFDWNTIKDEVYQRLIDQNLLYYANDADPEVQGQRVTKITQIKESVNEAKKQITIEFTKNNQSEVSSYVFNRLEHEKLVDTGKNGPDYMDLKFDAKNYDKVIDTLRRCDAIDYIRESVNEGVEEQIKKECISKLSDFFGCAPGNLSKFKFDGNDNIKELTKALRSTSDEGTAQYYRVAILVAKRDLGLNESSDKFVNATLSEDVEDLRKGSSVKIDSLDFTKRGDADKVTCIRPDGNTMEILKKSLTVKL